MLTHIAHKSLLIQILDYLPEAIVIVDGWQLCSYSPATKSIEAATGFISKDACNEIGAIELESQNVNVLLLDSNTSTFRVTITDHYISTEFKIQVRDIMSISFRNP